MSCCVEVKVFRSSDCHKPARARRAATDAVRRRTGGHPICSVTIAMCRLLSQDRDCAHRERTRLESSRGLIGLESVALRAHVGHASAVRKSFIGRVLYHQPYVSSRVFLSSVGNAIRVVATGWRANAMPSTIARADWPTAIMRSGFAPTAFDATSDRGTGVHQHGAGAANVLTVQRPFVGDGMALNIHGHSPV